ncbi:MAG: class I SAM-dependent methyltransferase [Gemmataceae bacterium]
MLAIVKQSAPWRMLRAGKRRLTPPVMREALSSADCRGEWRVTEAPLALAAGEWATLQLQVTNRGSRAWSAAGPLPVEILIKWFDFRGQPISGWETVRLPLPADCYPGEPQQFRIPFTAPNFVGDFQLHIDCAQQTPFAARHSHNSPASLNLTVLGRRETDIDYHAVYRTANLTENHWWVVGAYHSAEQYQKSSQDRLGMLQRLGLNPDSWVLDIGCGTGQMASVLMPYLTDRGGFSGTDIGTEAIAFCQQNFRRRNFRFAVGGMTEVPFDESQLHDFAIFFSVFTHTFTDESVLLLDAARRRLKPGGSVIADMIHSPLVERCAGHRGEMIVNRDHFLKLATMLGFTAEVVGEWNWNPHATRTMYRFRRT